MINYQVSVLGLFFCLIGYSQTPLEKEGLVSDYFAKGLALRHSQKDSSYYYLDLAAAYSIESKNYTETLEILLESIFASGIHYDLKRYRIYLDKMHGILEDNAKKMSPKDVALYQDLFTYEEGSYLVELKKFSEAKSRFKKLYDIYSKKDVETLDYNDLSILIYSTNVLASIYMDLGKYDLAATFFNRSLQVVENNKLAKEEGFDRATNRLLAQLYINMGKHESAEVLLKELLISYKKLYTNDKEYKNSLVVVYQRIVDNYIQQDSLQKALVYLDESQEYLIDDDPFYKQSLLLYGDIHLMQNNSQALQSFENAFDFFSSYRQNKPHEDIANVQGKIAEFYLKQGNFKEGLDKIQEAFASAGTDIKIRNIENNPDPQDVFSKTQLLNLLDIKLQLLAGMYKTNNDAAYLDMALHTSHDILKTFNQLKKEFDSKLDKQFLAEKVYPVFHRMLKITYQSYEINPSNKTLELAVNISEKNKDFLLLEALRSSNATEYGNIPQKLLDREAQYRAEMTYLEKEQFDSNASDQTFSEALFQLKQDYYIFLDTIKQNYPEYHNLKYGDSPIDLKTIQKKLLASNEQLISFTMTHGFLYAICLNEKKETILKFPFSKKDQEDVRRFYRLLSKPSVNDLSSEIALLGKRLYNKVLKEPLVGFEGENITIIADDVLHYLPFDLLQNKEGYLLEHKVVSYGNAISSLLALNGKQKSANQNVLAFAPSFQGLNSKSNERQFGKLLYNTAEVHGIDAFFASKIYMNSTATLKNFISQAAKYNVIHLATHASANDEFPDYSYLAFSDVSNTDSGNLLYIKDLYNTTLNADMVVLSACQTGIGKLQKGQGMMSLSKGFYYAGAKSLVTTLWKINDKSTVKLMEFFYENLSNGQSKKEALRQAKLSYLETTDDNLLKHPYYWAAFVVSGDASAISENKSYWWAVGIGLLLIIPIGFFKKKSYQNRALKN